MEESQRLLSARQFSGSRLDERLTEMVSNDGKEHGKETWSDEGRSARLERSHDSSPGYLSVVAVAASCKSLERGGEPLLL
jgi:hypothetical protein